MEGDPWLSEGVRCSLCLAGALLGGSLEEAGVPGSWREPPLPGWLVGAAYQAFGADRHYMHAGDPGELLLEPRRLATAARLRWANPIEATYRRSAPWDESPRFPIQLLDYVARSFGFLKRIPGEMVRARRMPRRREPPEALP